LVSVAAPKIVIGKRDFLRSPNCEAGTIIQDSAVSEALQIAQERFDELAASAELAINAAQALADQRQVQGPTNNGALNLTVEDFLNGLVFFGKGPGTTQEERIEDYERVIGGTDGGACTPINEEIIGIGDTKINTQ